MSEHLTSRKMDNLNSLCFLKILVCLCIPALTPFYVHAQVHDLLFTLDTTAHRYHYGYEKTSRVDTIYGSIQNLSGDSVNFVLSLTNIPSHTNFLTTANISGKNFSLELPDTSRVAALETIPIKIFIRFYELSPDTESMCFKVISLRDDAIYQHCIPIYVQGVIPPLQFTGGGNVQYLLGQPITTDTIHCEIKNITRDSVYYLFQVTAITKWKIDIKIGEKEIQGWDKGTLVGIGPFENLPVLVLLTPQTESADTQRLTFTVTPLPLQDSLEIQKRYVWLVVGAKSSISEEKYQPQRTRVYPNPSATSFTIIYTSELPKQKANIEIFNEDGAEVTDEFKITIFNDSIRIERKNAPSGSYFYRLVNKVSSQPSSVIGVGKFILQ